MTASPSPAGTAGLPAGTAPVDIDAVVTAVRSCPAVTGLDAGAPGSPATYLPGRRVAGVSVSDDTVTVQVRMRWSSTAQQVAAQVSAAVRPLLGSRGLTIAVTDIEVDSPAADTAAAPGTPPTEPPPANAHPPLTAMTIHRTEPTS